MQYNIFMAYLYGLRECDKEKKSYLNIKTKHYYDLLYFAYDTTLLPVPT